MVTDEALKVTTPVPEFEAEKLPLNVAEKLSEPADGTVCVMVSVKVPEAPLKPVPDTKVWKLPKLDPVGVFKAVEPRPVKVIISALPIPPEKVTEFVPLPTVSVTLSRTFLSLPSGPGISIVSVVVERPADSVCV